MDAGRIASIGAAVGANAGHLREAENRISELEESLRYWRQDADKYRRALEAGLADLDAERAEP